MGEVGINRRQRINLVRKIIAQYQTPCPWCKKERPGKPPNMVNVQIPNSHGICKECLEIMLNKIKQREEKGREQ